MTADELYNMVRPTLKKFPYKARILVVVKNHGRILSLLDEFRKFPLEVYVTVPEVRFPDGSVVQFIAEAADLHKLAGQYFHQIIAQDNTSKVVLDCLRPLLRFP